MENKNNKIDNKIVTYNDMLYKSSPVRAADYISDKYNDIHRQLYQRAVDKLLKELNISKEDLKINYKLVEIKQDEYFKPSKVIIKNLSYPFTATTYDLDKYWDNYEFLEEYKDLSEYWIDEESTKDAELIYIDYIKGKGKFKSKYTQKEFWVDFNYINENTRLNKDNFSLTNTFSYKLNNKIFGE